MRNFPAAETYQFMVSPTPPTTSPKLDELRKQVQLLRQTVHRLTVEREMRSRKRRRRLLATGLAVSVFFHLALLVYFAMMSRAGDGPGGPAADEYQFALVFDETLTTADTSGLDELDLDPSEELLSELTDASDDALADAPAAADLSAEGVGAIETLGGAGDGSAGGTLAGGAGTSYFGIEAEGSRFLYIVDRSGSMMFAQRMEIAMRELRESVESLPDYTSFQVIFFSSNLLEPDFQRGWARATAANIRRYLSWFDRVDPGGGTIPRPAFLLAFEMRPRPDVIFFMTDGIIPDLSAEEINDINQRGDRVVIHTIAFGDQGSEELLRRIARDSGGQYRYIPDGGR
ncbi:MAG: hypothetical protein EA377_08360 [Phycisphaerales bacterium]|nr:MAG: hypothetical protein EA377_08360 [Phycisphaerales bacterium]